MTPSSGRKTSIPPALRFDDHEVFTNMEDLLCGGHLLIVPIQTGVVADLLRMIELKVSMY